MQTPEERPIPHEVAKDVQSWVCTKCVLHHPHPTLPSTLNQHAILEKYLSKMGSLAISRSAAEVAPLKLKQPRPWVMAVVGRLEMGRGWVGGFGHNEFVCSFRPRYDVVDVLVRFFLLAPGKDDS